MVGRCGAAVMAVVAWGCGSAHLGGEGTDAAARDAGVAAADDGGSAADAEVSGDACEPLTCLGFECGVHDDGCGGTITCATCAGPAEECVMGACVCMPTTCADAGASCGEIPDGCGGTLACGSCATGEVCGGGGANVCGPEPCTPRACSDAGAQCGQVSDGCGGVLRCGSCGTGRMCSSNRCVARTYEDPTDSSTVNLADPDTVRAGDGRYITYGTTLGRGRGPRCGAPAGKLYVPYLVHGSGSSVGMSDCVAGDAMPGGPGGWAEPGGSIWAPGVARFGGRYIMFYTASRRGSGQKCIGRATSSSARGPFVSRGEWACPPAGRWAIDANPIVAGDRLYVTYRDDAINSFPQTGISVVRTDSAGRAVWSTRRDLLKSTDIRWDTIRMSGTTNVIENPSLFRHSGVWYLAFSGNNWDSARYATGIAECGSSILPARRCTPIRRGVDRPYFGFTGSGGLNPYRGLPGNHRGPGGMDVFRAADGTLRVVWHWWRASDRTRHVVVGRLLHDAGGFHVGP